MDLKVATWIVCLLSLGLHALLVSGKLLHLVAFDFVLKSMTY